MKRTFCAVAAIAGLLFSNILLAQKNAADTVSSKTTTKHVLTLDQNGIKIYSKDYSKDSAGKTTYTGDHEGRFSGNFAMVDLGINVLQDNTDYSRADVKAFLNVPSNQQNKSLFDLRQGKSINVNIYPWMIKFAALKTKKQRIYISSGIGLQLYNFRYESPLTYTKNPSSVTLDNISFKKDKLALDYLNVPLLFTFKTKLNKDHWLVYGAGITEGYRICSWTKQESGERGKVKVYDAFGLADFNTCVSGEIGIEGMFRFYGSYQVTSLYNNGLDQHPVSFGIRFGGI